MPNWKVHIEVGKRLNKYLNYNEEQLNMFLLGNILPDINNCFIVTNISKKFSHADTHLSNSEEISYKAFYNKYKDLIKKENPLILGYFTHLFVDYNFNQNYYKTIEDRNILEEHEMLKEMKQNDFKFYNNQFISNDIKLDNIEKCLEEINVINEISLTKDDIVTVLEFLKKQQPYDVELKFYTLEELNEVMEETVEKLQRIVEKII